MRTRRVAITWGIPQSEEAHVNRWLREALDTHSDVETRRAALRQLYLDLSYWKPRIDAYFTKLQQSVALGIPVFVVCLVLALVLFRGHPIWGALLGGAAGATLSVVLKLPKLDTYGRIRWFWIQVGQRLLLGVGATAIGIGLLASSIISIGLPRQDTEPPRQDAAGTFAQWIQRCGTGAAGQGSCGDEIVLFMVGVSMLLGFSERALYAFEQRLFGEPNAGTGALSEGEVRRVSGADGQAKG